MENKNKEDVWIYDSIEEVRGWNYGTIILKVHNGKVTDIEKRKKERLELTEQKK